MTEVKKLKTVKSTISVGLKYITLTWIVDEFLFDISIKYVLGITKRLVEGPKALANFFQSHTNSRAFLASSCSCEVTNTSMTLNSLNNRA